MKKITLLAVVIGAMSLASCKKNYTCTCTTTDSSSPSDPPIVTPYTVKETKKKAKDACNKSNQSAGTITTSCTLS